MGRGTDRSYAAFSEQPSANLVAATAQEVATLRPASAKTPAWRFKFSETFEQNGSAPDSALTITLSKGDFAVVEQSSAPEFTVLIDYRLGRVFYLDSASGTFSSASISARPYFLIYEWEHRLRMAEMFEAIGGKTGSPTLKSDFWRSHELGIRSPRRPAPDIAIRTENDELLLDHNDETMISMIAGGESLPPEILSRLWGVLLRSHPIHPAFVERAVADGLVPARLSFARHRTVQLEKVELRLRSSSALDYAYPLTPKFTAVAPSVEFNPRAAWLVAVAWEAARGNFAPGQPDTGYWRDRLLEAQDGSDLESALVYFALRLFAGSQDPGCDGAAELDPDVLCPLVKALLDRAKKGEDLGLFFALVGTIDKKGRQAAVATLPSYRDRAGRMAPLVDLFIANQISELTRVVTRGVEGLPDRDEAVELYLSALKTYPFIKQIYGDIADYYFTYFDMPLGFYFTDVGRSLPVAGKVATGSNLERTAAIERKLKQDYPRYY